MEDRTRSCDHLKHLIQRINSTIRRLKISNLSGYNLKIFNEIEFPNIQNLQIEGRGYIDWFNVKLLKRFKPGEKTSALLGLMQSTNTTYNY